MVSHRKHKIIRNESPPEPEPSLLDHAANDADDSAPTTTFLALCTAENIPVPSDLKQMRSSLRNAALAIDCTHLPRSAVQEHIASLLWLQAHATSADTLRALPHPLWCQLWLLYNIPPQFHPSATNYIRLAEWAQCNSFSSSTAAGGAHSVYSATNLPSPSHAARPFSLDTRRPLDPLADAEIPPQQFDLDVDTSDMHSLASRRSHGSHHQHHQRHHSTFSIRRQLSEELQHFPDVFAAIDLTRFLTESTRVAKVTACAKKNSIDTQDNENSPEFSILASFHLVPGSDVDLLKRGILLSQASVLPSSIQDSEMVTPNLECIRDKLVTAFDSSRSSWGSDLEIGGSIISKFRKFILDRYKSRLEIVQRDYPQCQTLLSHCKQQFQDLTSSGTSVNYFTQLDLHIANASRTSSSVMDFSIFNRKNLELIYPSIRSFLLLQPHASFRLIQGEIDAICTSSCVHIPPSPPAAPSFKKARLNATLASPTPQQSFSKRLPWMGLPFDKDVVGDDLGLSPAPPNACLFCSGPHFAVNCPTQYFLTCGEHCPGFNNKGERIPSAWNADVQF
jgi:hypothetical protein